MVPDLAPGLVVSGRYRLERELGRGGAGVVWSASDAGTRSVALKVLSLREAGDDVMRKRFLREARALSDLRHPGIVEVLEVVDLDGVPVIVMEVLEGENLRRRLERDRALSLPAAAAILAQVATAIAHAHRKGIVHRDLKPENIFLCAPNAPRPRVKVLDFGIAKLVHHNPSVTSVVTEIGVGLGTLHYAAPEQILNAAEVDLRADVWSLGVISYECLAGFRPIEGTSERDLLRRVLTDAIPRLSLVMPGIPDDVADIVARMLRRPPEERPKSVEEVEGVLARYAA